MTDKKWFGEYGRLHYWVRNVRLSWRWVFNVHCKFPQCSQGRICWRWHLETFTCPTCGHDCTEDRGPEFVQLTNSLFVDRATGWTPVATTGPRTSTHGTSSVVVKDCRINPTNAGGVGEQP